MRFYCTLVTVLWVLVEVLSRCCTGIFWDISEREKMRGHRGDLAVRRVALQTIRAVLLFATACDVAAIPTIAYLDEGLNGSLWVYGVAMACVLALNAIQLVRVWQEEKLCER